MTNVFELLNKTSRIPVVAIAALAFLITDAVVQAQWTSGPGSQSARGSGSDRIGNADLESSARASWQPVRDLSRSAVKQRPMATEVRLVDHQTASTGPSNGPVQTRRSQTGQPTPAPSPLVDPNDGNGRVVRDAALSGRSNRPSISRASAPLDSVPMDGQIIYEPAYLSGHQSIVESFHDPLYGDGCDAIGDYGVGMGGCDGLACSSGSCCNGDPMCGEYRDCDSLRPCITLCWPQDGWFSAEYLMWWQDGINLPPLASTGRLSDRAPLANGTVLFG